MDRRRKMWAARMLIATSLVSFAGPASASSHATCPELLARGSDFSSTSTVSGVRGILQTPNKGEVTGLASNRQSAGDVYMFDTAGSPAFVQVGWYLGGAAQLPYVTQPTMFFGEYHKGDVNNEKLRTFPGQKLDFGTYYAFKILEEGYSGKYDFYISNHKVGTSLYAQFDHSGEAAFNGETDWTCTVMEARAYADGPPASTLSWINDQGSWTLFSDHRSATTGYYSVGAGGQGTDFAYGGGG